MKKKYLKNIKLPHIIGLTPIFEEINYYIHRLKSIRAGSIFSNEFEGGMLYMLLALKGEQPDFQKSDEVYDWVNKTIGKSAEEEKLREVK